MIYRLVATVVVLAVNVHTQYYEWPQQQQQQQYNQFNNGYQPYQQQFPQQYQQFSQQPQFAPQPQFQQPPPPQQQFQQFQQFQQYQQPQQPVQYQQQPPPPPPPSAPPTAPQSPPPIYSQTVIIPQAPPPPPEAYQAQQYAPAQQAPVMVQPADIPRYHQKPAVPDVAFQHVDRARSVSQVDFDNKLFREQPNTFAQNQEKITLLAQPPPPPPPPAQTQSPLIRVPPPPARFIPSLKSLYNVDAPRPKNPTYKPDEIIVDGHRSAYFEDTQRTRPQSTKVRVQGGNVHSSSAAIPRVTQQVGQVAAVVTAAPRQFVRVGENSSAQQVRVVRPQQQTRPAPARPQTRRPVPQPQPATRPTAPRPVSPPKSHLAPQPAPVAAGPKPRTASEKFLQCCKGRKVNKSCERICSFDVLSKKTLTGMFLGTDPCPQHHGLDLMQCAADSDDHTQCCLDKEVDRTSAGKKCLGFCNMKPGITFQADVSMLPCWSVLNDIKQCFKENLERQLAAN